LGNQNFKFSAESKQIAFLIASSFVIHPQILMFSVFKIVNLSPYCIANKILHVTDF